jgi:mono/diheme cytochrome c family protein
VIPDPFGGAALGARARAYLHTNCANCHRPGGPTPSAIDLRYTTALSATNTCNVNPQLGALGISDPRLIAPGSAARSVVVARVNRIGADAMPPLSKHTVDTAGVQLLTSWVNGLTSCN